MHDDLLANGSDEKCLIELKNQLIRRFDMTIINNIEEFLGINMKWDKQKSIMYLYQE